jgi:Ca2+-binding EF-hand superfamily protein
MQGITGVGVNMQDEQEVKALLKKAFDKYDTNGSGELDVREFRKAWKHLGLSGADDEITDAFNKVDTNSSGVVDLA